MSPVAVVGVVEAMQRRRWCVVLLLCAVMSIASLRSSVPNTPEPHPSSTNAHTGTERDTSAQGGAPHTASSVDVVLTALLVKRDFYRNRKPPSMRWALAFFRSLHRHRIGDGGVPCRCVAFVDPTTGDALRPLLGTALLGGAVPFVTLVTVSNATHPALLSQPWASGIGTGGNNYRFALYYEWLHRERRGARRVMISDMTDVLFQRSPFAAPCFSGAATAATVGFTMESAAQSFAKEPYNRRWMRCVAPQQLPVLASRRASIACAGVTLGGAEGMYDYTARQVALIAEPRIVTCALTVVKAALDQATHNALLHLEPKGSGGAWSTRPSVPDFLPTYDGSPGVPTAVSQAGGCTMHGNYGRPALKDGHAMLGQERYSVVHQYTFGRHPAIADAAAARFDL